MGIGCFWTTKRSIIKAMIYRAMELRASLEDQGMEVLETYPYASKVRLFGKPLPKKSTPHGLAYLRDRLVVLMPTLEPWAESLDHDLCDALAIAYTALLHHRGRTEVLGHPQEGALVMPVG